jgi:hypothetical protein
VIVRNTIIDRLQPAITDIVWNLKLKEFLALSIANLQTKMTRRQAIIAETTGEMNQERMMLVTYVKLT